MGKKKCSQCEEKVNDSDFTVCGKCHKPMVINELLAYVSCYFKRATAVTLKIALSTFYDEDTVNQAKKELIQALSSIELQLGEAIKDRQNSPNRSAKDANIDDILAIFKIMDENLDSLENQGPVFCATDMTKLPPGGPEVNGNCMALFELLARQQQEIQQLQQSVSAINDSLARSKPPIPAAGATGGARPKTYATVTEKSSHDVIYAGTSNPKARRTALPVIVTTEDVADAISAIESEDSAAGFLPGVKRPQRMMNRIKQRGTAGTAADVDTLKAGADLVHMQITNVNPGTSADAIRAYVQEKDGGIQVENIEDASTEGWETKRFVLSFRMCDKDKVFDQNFWPARIYFKQWFMRKDSSGGFNSKPK